MSLRLGEIVAIKTKTAAISFAAMFFAKPRLVLLGIRGPQLYERGLEIGKTGDYRASARVARKFCGRLAISKLAIFWCFAGTNFYESANFVFSGKFLWFSESTQYGQH